VIFYQSDTDESKLEKRDELQAEKIHRLEGNPGSVFLVTGGGDCGSAGVGPGPWAGVAQMHFAVLAVAVALGTVARFRVGSDLVEAKNAHQNHSDKWGYQEKGLPAGLKGDSLHADPLV
jgi:hypothetical protein